MPKTVLIVEDNELNMKLFNDLVETRGHRIVQTRSGIEAVELARKHQPDLILMDIQLPEVSGLEVTQWLKDDEELRTIPVVAVTAWQMLFEHADIARGERVLVHGGAGNVGAYAAQARRAHEMLEGVRPIHAGKIVLAAEVAHA